MTDHEVDQAEELHRRRAEAVPLILANPERARAELRVLDARAGVDLSPRSDPAQTRAELRALDARAGVDLSPRPDPAQARAELRAPNARAGRTSPPSRTPRRRALRCTRLTSRPPRAFPLDPRKGRRLRLALHLRASPNGLAAPARLRPGAGFGPWRPAPPAATEPADQGLDPDPPSRVSLVPRPRGGTTGWT